MADGVYLYLLRMTGTDLFKIGISARPWNRLKQIAGVKHPVEVVRVWPELVYFEKALHRKWSHKRVTSGLEQLPASGRTEWFRLSDDDTEAIKADCQCEQMQHKERERLKFRARFSIEEEES